MQTLELILVENLLLDVQKMRERRHVVLAELLQYLSATHGALPGGVRFGRLLLFLREMSVSIPPKNAIPFLRQSYTPSKNKSSASS